MSRDKGVNRRAVNGITAKQYAFLTEYVQHKDHRRAAVAVGLSTESAQAKASMWLDPDLYPEVHHHLQRMLARIEERAVKKAEDVLAYIHTTMFYQPLHHFTRSDGEGGWLLTPEELRGLPAHIGCLIESVEHHEKTRVAKDGAETTERFLKVKLVSKTKAMELAAKHQLGEKTFSTSTVVSGTPQDWSEIFLPRPETVDPVVERMQNGFKELPNGEG